MITPDPNMGGNSRSSTDIESDIRRTRSRMDSTLDELGSQLTMRSVLHTLLDLWEARRPESPRAAARSRRVYGAVSQQLAHQVRENPVPSMLIGAAVAWAIYDKTRSHEEYEEVELGSRRYRVDPSIPAGPKMTGAAVTEYEYEDLEYDEIQHGPGMMEKAKEKLAEGKEAISDAAFAAREKISGKAGDLSSAAHEKAEAMRRRARGVYRSGRERGAHMGERVHHGYDTGTEKFTQAVDEYPLGVGIGFAALGALVGLLLPHTRKEDELLGERSDEILDVVKQKGRETLDRTKVVAEKVAETALDEAQRAGFTPEAASEKLSGIASKAGEVARRVKEEASSAAREQHLMPEKEEQQDQGLQQAEPTGSGMPSTGVETGKSVTMPPKGSSSQGGI